MSFVSFLVDKALPLPLTGADAIVGQGSSEDGRMKANFQISFGLNWFPEGVAVARGKDGTLSSEEVS